MMFIILNMRLCNINSDKECCTESNHCKLRSCLSIMKKINYSLLSERGVICYIFMCIERYIIKLYPDYDWKPAARNMWELTDNWWDEEFEGWFYLKVVPNRILQFDSYKDACIYDNIWKLSEDDYNAITSVYRIIEKHNGLEELDWLFNIPLLFMGIVYVNELKGKLDWDSDIGDYVYIIEMENILLKYGIELPDDSVLEPFKYEEKKIWIPYRKKDTTFLSIILRD